MRKPQPRGNAIRRDGTSRGAYFVVTTYMFHNSGDGAVIVAS